MGEATDIISALRGKGSMPLELQRGWGGKQLLALRASHLEGLESGRSALLPVQSSSSRFELLSSIYSLKMVAPSMKK